MKKVLFAVLAASSLFMLSCDNTKSEKSKSKDKEDVVSSDDDDDSKKNNDADEGSDYEKAAAAYCNCFNESIGDLNPRLKKIIIKASKTDNPQQAMQDEMRNIEDAEEKQTVATDARKLSNMEGTTACTNRVDKKYGLKENDRKAQRELLKAMDEDSDCAVVAALMRIGLSMKTTTSDQE